MVLRNTTGVMVSSNIDAYRIHLRKRKESEIYMKLIKQIPSEDGFYMPGEFEPHQGCILIWPKRPGSWGYDFWILDYNIRYRESVCKCLRDKFADSE